MKPPNAESIEQRVISLERALSTALLNAGRLARVVEEQSARIESLESGSRWAANLFNGPDMQEPEPDAGPPYRMAEPENVGAAVVDAGLFVWRLSSEARWRADEGMAWCQWADIADPQPYQNCTLTADDPEPPIGSVVRAITGLVRERSGRLWRAPWGGAALTWASVAASPVTLLYRGEA